MRLAIILKSIVVAASVAATTFPVSATGDLKDLLNTVKSKTSSSSSESSTSSALGAIGGLISGLVASSDFDIKDLEGTWQYQGPAVSFASDNALQKVGGAAAASTIENKIAPYYNKVGIQSLSLTVDAESNFTMTLRKITLKGTIEKDDNGNLTFNFSAMGKIKLGKIAAHATKSGNTVSLTFDISKLVSLLKTVSSVANVSSLNTISQLLSSYDGIYAGFKLKAVEQ